MFGECTDIVVRISYIVMPKRRTNFQTLVNQALCDSLAKRELEETRRRVVRGRLRSVG